MSTQKLSQRAIYLVSLTGWCIAGIVQAADSQGESTAAATPTLDSVIVTGTRELGKKSTESLSPVDVISGERLQSSGQTDLRDALVKIIPSITRQSMGYASSVFTNTLSLHGLSSNHVLVLVNGKRRHESSIINVWGGLQQGATGVDIDMIPVSAVERVEVLRDGASAQYGSDAIAGVINIILKSNDQGGSVNGTAGQYDPGDGFTHGGNTNVGLALGDSGFINLSAEYKEQEHTVRSGIDNRTGQRNNLSIGNPAVHRQSLAMNGAYALDNGIDFYSFATYAQRSSRANTHYRMPNILPGVYPNGFTAQMIGDDEDYALTVGAKGDDLLAGWKWDVSSTYGSNQLDTSVGRSGNVQLFQETGSTPTKINVGTFESRQWTNNLDLTKAFDTSILPGALNVALGAEYRREWYEVQAGEFASYYKGGSVAMAGQAPMSEGRWTRDVLAAYLDLSTQLTDKWQVDMAGRYEHFDDFGSTTNGKISTRYDFNPQVAIRASVSSGFRAPSLAQQNYTNLTVTPISVNGLVAVNSLAAQQLGAKDLKPEKSVNFGLGVVLSPFEDFTVAIDAYQIRVRDRIVAGSRLGGPSVAAALAASGITVPPVGPVTAQYLTNGAETRTRGVDITSNYKSWLGQWGTIDWNLSANFNRTKLMKIQTGPDGNPMLDEQAAGYVTNSTPRSRVTLGGIWSFDKWQVNLQETRYGKTSSEQSYQYGPNAFSTTEFKHFVNNPKYITDAEVRYFFNKNLQVSLGANNIFNIKPDKLPADVTTLGVMRYDVYATQIGLNGAYYFLQAGYTF
ncbi:hypothetical protein B1219_18580 [Pseudomonas ogarae]|uniref:TonB-dependent receptor plug domain-containing protein n=1 Tax=Pseudomonas ogarae (strain DSM 112162 / CECT 30235 / F113) TaxID=1114970 RepID=UPI0009A30972|nr:TonB-dependent receptor [Pseudomonas ogarae]OPG72157.1 hypothetical protein B1219_18580 [Pseudomonas ogarae]